MTEAQFMATVARLSPWAAATFFLVYILVNKLGPNFITAWSAARKASLAAERDERESIERVYERLLEREDQRNREMMALQKETVAFVTAATEAVHGLTRAVDGMERQVFELSRQLKQKVN